MAKKKWLTSLFTCLFMSVILQSHTVTGKGRGKGKGEKHLECVTSIIINYRHVGLNLRYPAGKIDWCNVAYMFVLQPLQHWKNLHIWWILQMESTSYLYIWSTYIAIIFIIYRNSKNPNIVSTWKQQELVMLNLCWKVIEFANGTNIDS